MIKRFCDRLCW